MDMDSVPDTDIRESPPPLVPSLTIPSSSPPIPSPSSQRPVPQRLLPEEEKSKHTAITREEEGLRGFSQT